MSKKGVLIVNLGTPDDPSRKSVYKYLKQFLLDPRVIDVSWLKRNFLVRGIIAPFRSKPSSEIYQMLWSEDKGSPIKYYGNILVDEVSRQLGDGYLVELAMRYQSPSIESKLTKLLDQNIDELVVLPLFPQYASASTGSVNEEVMRVLSKREVIPSVKWISSFCDDPDMIDIFVENANQHNPSQYDHVLFSFHGLPQRQLLKADVTQQHCLKVIDCCKNLCQENNYCYSAQCFKTAQLIAQKMNLSEEDYTICFQSRLGKEPWTQPFTPDIIKRRREMGDEKLLVFSPSFVADCLETTIEIGHEYLEDFQEMGGKELDLVESLNDHPKWIDAVVKMVR